MESLKITSDQHLETLSKKATDKLNSVLIDLTKRSYPGKKFTLEKIISTYCKIKNILLFLITFAITDNPATNPFYNAYLIMIDLNKLESSEVTDLLRVHQIMFNTKKLKNLEGDIKIEKELPLNPTKIELNKQET